MTRILNVFLLLSLSAAALADSADIRLVGPQPQQRPNQFTLIFAMVNDGPDFARKTFLVTNVPAGVTVNRFSFGSGDMVKDCDKIQRPIRCEVGDMHTGLPPYYGSIDVTTPIADASYTLTLALESETPDPNLNNNSISASWETKVEADVGALLIQETDRADPGGEGHFVAYVCNNTQGNRPPTVRVELTATNGTIAGLSPATGFTCTNEVTKTVCTIPELPYGCPAQPFKFYVRVGSDRSAGESRVTIRATGDLAEQRPGDNEQTKVLPVYKYLPVTTTADSGPGSLRETIKQANAECTPGPCRIVFEIPGPVPAEGWFTITPADPLPSITAERVTLEGSRQAQFTGNTNPKGPEIAIDGHLAHRGIRMLSQCEGVVDGLAIGNFDEDQGLWISSTGCNNRPDRREVINNHIGVNPTGDVPWPNLRGLRADFAYSLAVSRNVISHNLRSGIWMWRGGANIASNLIEFNGASGMLLGEEVLFANANDNVIRNNAQMGIAVGRNADSVQMRRNVMKDNGGLGIDWGLDDVSPTDGNDHEGPTNAPVILAATYDPPSNLTTVTLTIKSTPLGPYFNYGTFDFYANAGPDGDGEQYLGGQSGPFEGSATFKYPGNLRGKWINATFTREHQYGARTPEVQSHFAGFAVVTSELSNTVLVQ